MDYLDGRVRIINFIHVPCQNFQNYDPGNPLKSLFIVDLKKIVPTIAITSFAWFHKELDNSRCQETYASLDMG